MQCQACACSAGAIMECLSAWPWKKSKLSKHFLTAPGISHCRMPASYQILWCTNASCVCASCPSSRALNALKLSLRRSRIRSPSHLHWKAMVLDHPSKQDRMTGPLTAVLASLLAELMPPWGWLALEPGQAPVDVVGFHVRCAFALLERQG